MLSYVLKSVFISEIYLHKARLGNIKEDKRARKNDCAIVTRAKHICFMLLIYENIKIRNIFNKKEELPKLWKCNKQSEKLNEQIKINLLEIKKKKNAMNICNK